MWTNGSTDTTIITGINKNPIMTMVRSAVMVHPMASITSHATWYHRDCSAWKEIFGDLSLYISQITSAATGPRKPVTRFKKTERWARADQLFSSLEPRVVVETPGPEPPLPEPPGWGSTP